MAAARSSLPVVHARPAAAPLARSPLERAGEEDLFHDYVLSAYAPLAPHVGKLRSLNLLVESFAVAGLEAEGLSLLRCVREGLGAFRTVWGVKRVHATGALGWELYFYDWERAHADLSLPRLQEIFAPVVEVDAREPYPLPWHMVSIEVSREALARRGRVGAHLYIDMRSYALLGEKFTFENVYTFHDPRTEVDMILHRLKSSVHFDPERDGVAALMPPPLRRCGKVCVANKRSSDAVYFSRIRTPDLAWFLRTHAWPEEMTALVGGRAMELDHLLWDVGVDFDRAGGVLTARKTGVYGSF
ncbi:hypothetical protein [Chondromyces apiculatus]|uniref:Uncharacterized protein n=1 Tax=Chondromyces apiculatus DSM 436 TaxID=1192034 RepID=A0A017SYA1_9BACT|nr:hypothetical protein [Chondromyces apiculatus]EYF01752.1 Hypothetical protein CAP_7818 [Chondromyces apiculatus DSM 436]